MYTLALCVVMHCCMALQVAHQLHVHAPADVVATAERTLASRKERQRRNNKMKVYYCLMLL
jgi:hypothetical protein